MKDENKKMNIGVDIEIHVKYNEEYVKNFCKYFFTLKNAYEYSFVVISLFNFDKNENFELYKNKNKNKNKESNSNDKEKEFKRWIGIGPSIFDENNNSPKPLYELYSNTYCFDLNDEKENIFEDDKIKLNNKIINNKAKAWLMLLNLRQWTIKDSLKIGERFIITADLNGLNDEIINAILILKNVDNIELIRVPENQENIVNLLINEREEGEKEGYEKGIKKGIKIGIRKAKLERILDKLNSGNNLDNYKNLTQSFSKYELEKIKNFVNEQYYDIKDFSKDLAMDEQDILEICESLGLVKEKIVSKKLKMK